MLYNTIILFIKIIIKNTINLNWCKSGLMTTGDLFQATFAIQEDQKKQGNV